MVGIIYHHRHDIMAGMRTCCKYFYGAIYILQELPSAYGNTNEVEKMSLGV